MSNQLLFYERATPLSRQRHAEWSIETDAGYSFARNVNSVPVMAVEIPLAARDYAVVFAGSGETIVPAVILGLEGQENTYINEAGEWSASYIPAFVRRYPFVFARNDNDTTFTLCIDEGWSGCNQSGAGERLFNESGEQTAYLTRIVEFMREYQAHFRRTQAYCQKLEEHGLLEQLEAQFTTPGGDKRALTGFKGVNRDKLKALPGDALAELARSDELELTYTHLQSMNNLSRLAERLSLRGEESKKNPESVSG